MDLEQNLTKVNANEVNQALQKFEWDNAAGGVKDPEAFVKTIGTLYQGREFLKDPEGVFADVGRIGENQEVWKLVYGGLMDTDADSTLTQQKKVLAMQTYLGLAKILGIGQAVPVIGTQMAELEAKYAIKSELIEPDATNDAKLLRGMADGTLSMAKPEDESIEERAHEKRPYQVISQEEIDSLLASLTQGAASSATPVSPSEVTPEERAHEKRPYQVISQEEIDSLLASLAQGAASSTTPVSPPEVTPKATAPEIDTNLISSHQDQDAGEIEKRRIEALLAKSPWDCNPEELDERAKILVQRVGAQTNNPTQADLKAAQANTDRMAEDFARKVEEAAAQQMATPEPPRPEIITLGPGDLRQQVVEALERSKNRAEAFEVAPETIRKYAETDIRLPQGAQFEKLTFQVERDGILHITSKVAVNKKIAFKSVQVAGVQFDGLFRNNEAGGIYLLPEYKLGYEGAAGLFKDGITKAITDINGTIIETLNSQLPPGWQVKSFQIKGNKLAFDVQR